MPSRSQTMSMSANRFIRCWKTRRVHTGKTGDSMATLRTKLDKSLGPALTAQRYSGYIVVDKKKRIVAAGRPELIGQQDIPEYNAFLTRALDGATTVSAPFPSEVAMKDDSGRKRTGVPTMFVCAPIRDESFQVVGVLGLRIDPDKEFSRILQLGRVRRSGETYAFDKRRADGFQQPLRRQALFSWACCRTRRTRVRFLQLLVRDPGGDMTAGHRPTARRRELPLTTQAAEAVAGRAGVECRRLSRLSRRARSSAPGSGCPKATSASSPKWITPRRSVR